MLKKWDFWAQEATMYCQTKTIRFPVHDDRQQGLYWASEGQIKETAVIAPIFATITREAWKVAKFPSTNWYSDNIICHDLQEAG
jgi:hypothetical protein